MRSAVLACAILLAVSPALAAGVSKGPWVQHVGTTSATVRLEVDPPGPVTLELNGPTGLDGSATRTIAAGEKTSYHSLVLDGLVPATRYTYTVRAAGESRVASFTTAPDKNVPFHFLVYGDNRTDDAAHAAIVRAMTPVKSDFVVNTGDFVEVGETPSEWQTFFEIEAPLLRERCLFACIGNHELIGGAGESFVKYFGPNETSATGPEQLQGTFRWGSARFFLVNGMVRYRSGPDRSWLERVLAQSDGEKDLVWRIVVVHHGPWSSGPHGDNRELWAAGVVDLFEQHKIDLVIAGHDHIYERGWADGMGYLVSGGGGAPPYRIKTPRASARKVESSRHFIDAAVTDAAIALTALRPDGTTIEQCGLRKSGGWDCDGAPVLSPAASSSSSSPGTPAAAPAEPPPPSTASRCACRAAGLSTAGREGLVILLALGAAILRRLRTS